MHRMELRNNLPHSLTSFVGRRREVRQVRALVSPAGGGGQGGASIGTFSLTLCGTRA
jgi:hypothetical protein